MKKIILISGLPLLIFSVFIVFSCHRADVNEPASGSDTPNLNTVFVQAEQIINLESIVIYRNGNLIQQTFYGNGSEDVTNDVRSVTKSITGLLIGIAIEKGFIKSPDQQISEFAIPSHDSIPERMAKIKIRDLLTMTSGFEWEELSSVYNYNWWIASANQIEYLFKKPLVNEPGKRFTYNSAAFHLLSVILTNASKMPLSDFAAKYLFEPLGIGARVWEKDHQGFNNGSAGLELTTTDMARIGQLVLNRGVYNGKQIVSPQWIDESTTPKVTTNNAVPFGPDYGYGWWIGDNSQEKYMFANGYGGQFIVVVPDLNLVVVTTNHWKGIKSSMIRDQWNRTISLVMTQIVPSFR